ncbi:hypothetical protein OESDEN_25198 [Oesophagostomum dentatum]|uniref:Uncharacterized protein n=1 Tax=Oesophagostomum dentatum TaxID=61180 RepID=A0A0B1RU82_OESDE|nr:hypothetical protein OESDEN_25198 [Oesophagostomum dentatum]
MEANDPDSAEQPVWMKELEPDTFDYAFGMKFPVQGVSAQHSDFAEELLDRIESRRIEVRKSKKKKKLMPWKKIIPLDYCPLFMDFERVGPLANSSYIAHLQKFIGDR